MAFKRALWHSGLTYEQTCEQCQTVVRYVDNQLDFRPWYPDGFVYCPRCKTPLRHNEAYAVNVPEAATVIDLTAAQPSPQSTSATPTAIEVRFCSRCGNQFNDLDRFCSRCGAKRGE